MSVGEEGKALLVNTGPEMKNKMVEQSLGGVKRTTPRFWKIFVWTGAPPRALAPQRAGVVLRHREVRLHLLVLLVYGDIPVFRRRALQLPQLENVNKTVAQPGFAGKSSLESSRLRSAPANFLKGNGDDCLPGPMPR